MKRTAALEDSPNVLENKRSRPSLPFSPAFASPDSEVSSATTPGSGRSLRSSRSSSRSSNFASVARRLQFDPDLSSILPIAPPEPQPAVSSSIPEDSLAISKHFLAIQPTPPHGSGVFTDQFLPRSSFVCEYSGEFLTLSSAEERERFYENSPDCDFGCYMFYLTYKREQYCIDATMIQKFRSPEKVKGKSSSSSSSLDNEFSYDLIYGFGRYINHSRKTPNLYAKIVNIPRKSRSPEDSVPIRLYFYAKRDIFPGEELLIDYGDRDPENCEKNPWLLE